MHQRKSKKVLIYFFLLFLVGSINNIELNNVNFGKITDITITGLEDNNNLVLLKEVKKLNLRNIFSINEKEIINQINSNNVVEEFRVFKRYPSSLDVNVEKTKFLARVNYQGKIFILGSNGKLSSNNFSNSQLPFIFGQINIAEFLNIKKIVDQSKFSYDEIKNLYFFSSKRWDLKLKNDVLIKLSKNHTKESLELAFEFLQNNDFRDIKIIDTRVKNQIIVHD